MSLSVSQALNQTHSSQTEQIVGALRIGPHLSLEERQKAKMMPEPLKSALSLGDVEDTSLALPSDRELRSAQQRVLEQVHTIKRSKSKYSSKSVSGVASPTSEYISTLHLIPDGFNTDSTFLN